jgi:hypothetical protein
MKAQLVVLLSAVRELGVFVRTFLLNLYLKEMEGLGLGPHRRGGAIVAPRHRGQGPNPNNGKCQTKLKPA